MQGDVIKELVVGTYFARSVDGPIKEMLNTHVEPQAVGFRACVASELLSARGELLAYCGRHLLNVGQVLEQAAKQAIAKRQTFAPQERSHS